MKVMKKVTNHPPLRLYIYSVPTTVTVIMASLTRTLMALSTGPVGRAKVLFKFHTKHMFVTHMMTMMMMVIVLRK